MYRFGTRPDPAELGIWEDRFGTKMVANEAGENGQKRRLQNLKNRGART